jgi:hypothetical protein
MERSTAGGGNRKAAAQNSTAVLRFYGEPTQEFFSVWGVFPLFSPPHTPRYNGAIEAIAVVATGKYDEDNLRVDDKRIKALFLNDWPSGLTPFKFKE